MGPPWWTVTTRRAVWQKARVPSQGCRVVEQLVWSGYAWCHADGDGSDVVSDLRVCFLGWLA